jgi:hypothetical protein
VGPSPRSSRPHRGGHRAPAPPRPGPGGRGDGRAITSGRAARSAQPPPLGHSRLRPPDPSPPISPAGQLTPRAAPPPHQPRHHTSPVSGSVPPRRPVTSPAPGTPSASAAAPQRSIAIRRMRISEGSIHYRSAFSGSHGGDLHRRGHSEGRDPHSSPVGRPRHRGSVASGLAVRRTGSM